MQLTHFFQTSLLRISTQKSCIDTALSSRLNALLDPSFIIVMDTPAIFKELLMAGSNHIPKFPGENGLISRIARYINEHMKKDLTLTSVADHFGVSTSTLQNLVKKHLKQTFQKYLEDQRMAKAFSLVVEGRRIKEIMQVTGYKYRSTFNAAFLKKYKHPPKYFRK